MIRRIQRFTPHQNAKVVAVLTGAVSVLFVAPLMVFMFLSVPRATAPPAFLVLLLPLGYAVMSYLFVVAGCALYNVLYKYIGGIEFEERANDA